MRLLFLLVPSFLYAQGNQIQLCDQQVTRHCLILKAPTTLSASPSPVLLSGKSGGLLVGLASTDLSILTGAIVSADAFISASATTNASIMSMAATPSTGGADISVSKTGSGTLLPMRFFRNPTEVARIDTSNRFLFGLTSTDVSTGLGSIIVSDSLITATAATNASVGSFAAIASNYLAISSSKTGSGTYLPTVFFTSGTERMRIAAAGGVTITGGITVTNNIILTGGILDATGLGGALNINGSTTTNGNIVLNPGNVSGQSYTQINGHATGVTDLALTLNEAGSPTGTGIVLRYGGTYAATWQGGSGAAFDVVGSDASTHRFILYHNGHIQSGANALTSCTASSGTCTITSGSNDVRGSITGSLAGATFTITFGTAYSSAPFCVANNAVGGGGVNSVSTTTLGILSTTGIFFEYLCIQ